MRTDDDDKVRGLVRDTRWVVGKDGKRRLVEDEVDPQTYAQRRREAPGWRNGARVKS